MGTLRPPRSSGRASDGAGEASGAGVVVDEQREAPRLMPSQHRLLTAALQDLSLGLHVCIPLSMYFVHEF